MWSSRVEDMERGPGSGWGLLLRYGWVVVGVIRFIYSFIRSFVHLFQLYHKLVISRHTLFVGLLVGWLVGWLSVVVCVRTEESQVCIYVCGNTCMDPREGCRRLGFYDIYALWRKRKKKRKVKNAEGGSEGFYISCAVL